MTIQVGGFTSWQAKANASKLTKYNYLSPNLESIRNHLATNFGGTDIGGYLVRNIRGGGFLSSHAFGAAQDISFREAGRDRMHAAIAFLVANSAELGVQAIHDYSGPGLTGNDDRGYIWRTSRSSASDEKIGWKKQRRSSGGMGQTWADWIHVEVCEPAWFDGRPVDERLAGGVASAVAAGAGAGAGATPFDPANGEWGPWQTKTNKPRLARRIVDTPTEREATRYLQGVLNTTGAKLLIDGDFGPKTEHTVHGFQTAQSLGVDGVVGKKTWGQVDVVAGDASKANPLPADPPTEPEPTGFHPEQGAFEAWPTKADKPLLALGQVDTEGEREATRYLQGVAASVGYVLPVDGTFSDRTELVVKKIQGSNGLSADGSVDVKTWKVIDAIATS